MWVYLYMDDVITDDFWYFKQWLSIILEIIDIFKINKTILDIFPLLGMISCLSSYDQVLVFSV